MDPRSNFCGLICCMEYIPSLYLLSAIFFASFLVSIISIISHCLMMANFPLFPSFASAGSCLEKYLKFFLISSLIDSGVGLGVDSVLFCMCLVYWGWEGGVKIGGGFWGVVR